MNRGENPQSPQQRDRHLASFPAPQQVFLEDLTLVIDVCLMVAFAAAVHLLRKRVITVATLAHILSVVFLVVTAGHYVERHVVGGIDEVEDLVRRRGPARASRGWWITTWFSAGLVSTAAVLALVARLWNCKGEGDCLVGSSASIHYPCKRARLRFFAPVFAATVVFVYLCIISRLNALLGGSVLHPTGGGYALAVLASPALLLTLCLSGCASVWLFSVLIEEQASTTSSGRGADGRYLLRPREGDKHAGMTKDLDMGSSRRRRIQRHPIATQGAVWYDSVGWSPFLQTRHRHFSRKMSRGRTLGVGPASRSNHQHRHSSAAPSRPGIARASLRYDPDVESARVGEFGGVSDGRVSCAQRSSFREEQARRRSTRAASPFASGASPNRLRSDSSILRGVGKGLLNHSPRGVAAGDGNSDDSKEGFSPAVSRPPLSPFLGRDGHSSDGEDSIGSMVAPSPHPQKGEGTDWTPSSSSTSSSSSSSSAWGRGETRRNLRGGILADLGHRHDSDSSLANSSDERSSRSCDSTDSHGRRGGFRTTMTAPQSPLSSLPRTTLPSPQFKSSWARPAAGKESETATWATSQSAGETATDVPPQSRGPGYFPCAPAPSHSPAPWYPPAASYCSSTARSRPIRSRSSAEGSGGSTNSSSDGGHSGSETGRSIDSRSGRMGNDGSGDPDIRGNGRFPLRREDSGGDTTYERWKTGRRKWTASSSSSTGDREGVEDVLSRTSGGGGRESAVSRSAAIGRLRGSLMTERDVESTGIVDGGWNGAGRGDRPGGSVLDSDGLRPSQPDSLLRRRCGWGT